MTVPSLPVIAAPSPAPAAGAGLSASDIIAAITAFFALLTVVAAVVYARKSATDMRKSLEEAQRLRLFEFFSRRTALLGEIVDVIVTMIWIPSEVAGSQFTGDPLELFDYRFDEERRKLIIALAMLPNIPLTKCRNVADIGHFLDALPELKPAGIEANEALTVALAKLEEEARKVEEGALPSLLGRLRQREPAFLERLVLALLTDTDYGRAAAHIRKVGGQGLHGAIRQDPLAPVRLYVQANRYEMSTAVGQSEIHEFAQALHEARAEGGIFLTTSHFTPAAIAYAGTLAAIVILIDGPALVALMTTSTPDRSRVPLSRAG